MKEERRKKVREGGFFWGLVAVFFCLVRVQLLEQEDNREWRVEGVDVCEVSLKP